MPMLPNLDAVFGHFQNLNLLALLQDLRDGRVARWAWLSGSLMCPVSHGMSQGEQVRQLRAAGHLAELSVGCDLAARHLGADPSSVLCFVRCWDDELLSDSSLLHALQKMWEERLADAQTMQEFLQSAASSVEGETNSCAIA